MPQVSKRILHKDVEKRIFSLFWMAITRCKSQEKTIEFLTDLLTPTEQLMLAKRISIAFLLLRGYRYESVMGLLKVSRSTVAFVGLSLKEKGSGYRQILSTIRHNEQFSNALDKIDEAFEDIFLPPRNPANHRIRNRNRREKRLTKSPF